MAMVEDVAAAVLTRHLADPRFGQMTTMKLHKLLYAAQGVHLAEHGDPEFDNDELEAWDDGPVAPAVWRIFAGRRYLSANDLTRLGDPAALTDDESAAVDKALSMFGSFSGDALSDLSHVERPWVEAYGMGRNTRLSPPTLAGFFSDLLAEESKIDPDDAVSRLLDAL